MLKQISLKDNIDAIRKKIQKIKSDIDELGEPTSEIPELITLTNLLRSNEYLSKVNEKKTDLLIAYDQYSVIMEKLLSSVFEIQNDLKEILRKQSSLISSQRNKRLIKKTKSKKTKK